jgi:sugar transferase (PEP-CTERM system associated)
MVRHWLPTGTILLIGLEGTFLFLAVLLVVALAGHGDPAISQTVVPSALLFSLAMVGLNSALGLYRNNLDQSWQHSRLRMAISLVLALPVAYAVFVLLPWGGAPEGQMFGNALLVLAMLTAVRGYRAHTGASPLLVRRVLVLGTGKEAVDVERSLRKLGPNAELIGFVQLHPDEESQVSPDRIVEMGASLAATARGLGVQDVVLAVRERRGGVLPLGQLLECKLQGLSVLDLSTYFERALGQVNLDTLRASWLIFGEGFRQGKLRSFVKRTTDVLASSLLILLSAPIMVLTVIAIALEDGFPILYRQERVGQGGRVFRVLKFRSMRRDAEKDGNPRWAKANDDRVTRVGRFIRKVRIDELPQLINVLKGDMSLVGPRPERPFFVEDLNRQIPYYAARHSIKPGVTGWAQVRYHYGSSLDDAIQKLQYDLYYVKNHRLILDLLILFETVGVVLTGKGAK